MLADGLLNLNAACAADFTYHDLKINAHIIRVEYYANESFGSSCIYWTDLVRSNIIVY